jgi:uncharacterized membrane protein YfcA
MTRPDAAVLGFAALSLGAWAHSGLGHDRYTALQQDDPAIPPSRHVVLVATHEALSERHRKAPTGARWRGPAARRRVQVPVGADSSRSEECGGGATASERVSRRGEPGWRVRLLGEVGHPAVAVTAATAGLAGLVTGIAGFGTGLVAAGVWLHVLPAPVVPPLVVICSVGGQLASLVGAPRAIRWRELLPYLAGALVGVPLGVLTLGLASPAVLRPAIGLFLVAFVIFETAASGRLRIGTAGGRRADALVGAGGGFLGGFAGLSGALPIVWLRIRGGSPDSQRAIYQPFNLLVLSATALVMGMEGRLDGSVLVLAMVCLPATLLGASLGVRCYRRAGAPTFRRVVLALLFVSGLTLTLSAGARGVGRARRPPLRPPGASSRRVGIPRGRRPPAGTRRA